jgi:hypothetical protein
MAARSCARTAVSIECYRRGRAPVARRAVRVGLGARLASLRRLSRVGATGWTFGAQPGHSSRIRLGGRQTPSASVGLHHGLGESGLSWRVQTWGFPSQFIIRPRGQGYTSRAKPGVSLPSRLRTRNLRILDPAYKPLRYSGVIGDSLASESSGPDRTG